MSDTKTGITEGEWFFRKEPAGISNLIFSSRNDHGYIAEVNASRVDFEANREAIAALPEIFAALKAARQCINQAGRHGVSSTKADQVLNVIDDALAKAGVG